MTKSMVTSLLTMAVSATVALANGGGGEEKKTTNETGLYQGAGTWSFKPGSGITYDGGDTFKLTMVGQLQSQWAFGANDNAPDTNSFTVRRARIAFSGHVWSKDIMFMLRLDAVDSGAGNGPIKDGWIHWNFMSSDDGTIGVRTGQGKPFFGLESTGSSSGLDFVERSMTTKAFSDMRSRGAWLHGSHAQNKFRWNFGAQNGDVAGGSGGIAERGEETANVDNELNWVGNVSFDPLGDFMGGKTNESYKQADLEGLQDLKGTIGAGVLIGNHRDPANTVDIETTSININTAWKVQGFAAQGEVFLRTDDPTGGTEEDSEGWYVQGSYTLPKAANSDMQWGFAGRIAMIDSDNTTAFLSTSSTGPWAMLGGAPGDILEITGGLNAFYHGHACKTQINYTFQDVNPDSGTSSTNHIIAIQITLLF